MDSDFAHGLVFASRTSSAVLLDGRSPAVVPGLQRVRRGVYVDDDTWDDAKPTQRYELLVRATVPELKRPAPLAHESAAVLLGLPIVGRWPDHVHLLEKTADGGRSSALVVRHGTRTMPKLVLIDGIAMTSPARTAVDLARTRSFASGLATADHVLRLGLATRADLEAELAATPRAPGNRRARLVVAHADPRSESVGESLSRAQLIELDLPRPELQQEFYDADGFIGRTDFWWPKLRLIGEFDGKVKFGRELVASDAAARERLWLEKKREDRLRRLGNSMVRWTWDEVYRRDVFARLLANAGVH